jgi:exosortase
LAGAAVLVMGDAWLDIASVGWTKEELSYVLIAPLVIGWIAWSRRHRLRGCRGSGAWIGLVLVVAGWIAYRAGYAADRSLWRLGAVVAAVGCVVVALGGDAVLKFAPAFGAALFLVPIHPNGRYQLALPLQNVTARATQEACDLLGIEVQRTGSLLVINGTDVTVAEACNGMRMILTLFMVCYVVAFTVPLRAHVRVLLLAASPLVAVVANVLRLVPTVWLFGHSTATTAQRFHDVSGWVMTVAAFLLLMAFVQLLRAAPSHAQDGCATPPAAGWRPGG